MNQTVQQPLLCYHHLTIKGFYFAWTILLLGFIFFIPHLTMARHISNDNTAISPFDLFLRRDDSTLSQETKRGYERFQTLGVFIDYLKDRKNINQAYFGRFNVTGLPQDSYVFKVPSLRLVAWSAPYFHDRSVKTLPKAVRMMGKYQLGRKLFNENVHFILAFLRSLSGDLYKASEK